VERFAEGLTAVHLHDSLKFVHLLKQTNAVEPRLQHLPLSQQIHFVQTTILSQLFLLPLIIVQQQSFKAYFLLPQFALVF
jgi:hypothetical protein